MEYQVHFQTVAPRSLAVVQFCAPQKQLSRLIPQACGEVWNFVRAANIKTAGRHVAVYYDGAINVESGAEVDEPFTSDGRVIASATPGGRVAMTAHFGPYQLLSAAHQAVLPACQSHGDCLAGPSWEIYGHWTDDPTQLRTDIFYLLK
ncbi:MAG: GyrI-like domain-containing protein [Singulisphaera sp.]